MYLKLICGHILSLMTIFQGSEGSICLYYKGKLISSYPLSKNKTLKKYLYQGEDMILKSLKQSIDIKKQIKLYLYFCNMVYNRKINNKPIYRSDHIYFLNCLTALLKLKLIDNDESNGYMTFPRYQAKLKKPSSSSVV